MMSYVATCLWSELYVNAFVMHITYSYLTTVRCYGRAVTSFLPEPLEDMSV